LIEDDFLVSDFLIGEKHASFKENKSSESE